MLVTPLIDFSKMLERNNSESAKNFILDHHFRIFYSVLAGEGMETQLVEAEVWS